MENLKNVAPIEDFNWDAYENGESVASASHEELEKAYDNTLNKVNDREVVDGTVIAMNKREVVVNIGYKSDGIIPLNEFRYNPDLKVGDTVEVYIENQEDKKGQLVLSHRKARATRSWDRVNAALENEEIIKGYIKCRTKGGMIVDVFGIEAFLPGSQIDVKPIRDYDVFVGKTMEFKVVKINQEFKNVVVSHKALIEAELEQQKKEIIGKLEKGQVLEGTVKNITSYGVFIDLGGVDGLIHITDLSWGRVNHPEEIVQLDQKLNVVILDFDDAKKRIALGLKQLSAHPWDALDANLKVGDKVKGRVVVMADYGAFVEIAPGVEGLIHVSEMSWSQHLRSAQEFMKVGDEVAAGETLCIVEAMKLMNEITSEEMGTIREVCLESRTHPEFCRDGWWADLRFIIGECKRLGLKVWLLDDAHFPTGYANGALAGEDVDPALKKTVLKHRTVTVVGPQPSTVIKLGNLMDPTERFVGAATFDAASAPLDLELSVEQADGTPARLRFDAPDGIATVELYVTSQKTGFRDEYINMVDADSCRVLIDAVYEPTFEHLGDEFGCTILGFFTDEPGFMNEKGTALDDASTSSFIGRGDMALPWSDELARRLHEALGASWLAELRGLWTREADGARVRHTYMDIATQLYRTCFDEQIGDWCREHGVMHIGHVIEDKSCHTRLGQGAGHYFRAVAGQDMAGIDVVINQLAPGVDHGRYSYFHGAWNMEFFT